MTETGLELLSKGRLVKLTYVFDMKQKDILLLKHLSYYNKVKIHVSGLPL